MTIELSHAMQLAYSTKKQAAWGTALLDGSLTKGMVWKKGGRGVKRHPALVSNADEAGRGIEFASDAEVLRKHISLDRGFDLSSEMAGWLFSFGMGACASAQQGGTSAYKHTHTLQVLTTSDQPPFTSLVEVLTSGIKKKISDVVVGGFRISGERGNPRIGFEASLIGSGQEAASSLSMPAADSLHYLPWSGVSFKIGTRDSEAEVNTRLVRFDVSFENNLQVDQGHLAGGGVYLSECRIAPPRSVKLNFTLLADSTSTILDDFLAATERSCLIVVTGALIESTYYHELQLDIPNFIKADASDEDVGGRVAFNVSAEAYYHAGTTKLFSAYVINTETAYLGAEA